MNDDIAKSTLVHDYNQHQVDVSDLIGNRLMSLAQEIVNMRKAAEEAKLDSHAIQRLRDLKKAMTSAAIAIWP